MTISFVRVTTIGRASGRSAVGAAAYRAGERLEDYRDGRVHDYSGRSGIGETWIDAPANAPYWVHDREDLWNHVEGAEKRCDARLAREVTIAIPRDVALHSGDHADHNPHAHVLLTTRSIDEDGFGGKVREWDHRDRLDEWKAGWEDRANDALEHAGRDEWVDFRSYEERGLDRLPEVHEGPAVRALEDMGIPTREGDHNREVREYNRLAQDREDIERKAQELEREREHWGRRAHDWERAGYTPEAARTLADEERERGGEYTSVADAKHDIDQRTADYRAEGGALRQERDRLDRIERVQAEQERAQREVDEARDVGRVRLFFDYQARVTLENAERRLEYAERIARDYTDLPRAIILRQEHELAEREREHNDRREEIRELERARHELDIGGGQAERDRQLEREHEREMAREIAMSRADDMPGSGRDHDPDYGRGDTWGFGR